MTHLREYIYGAGQMDAEAVARDDECEIGQWLYREGAEYRRFPEYRHALQVHAAFHRRAAKVVRMADQGRRLEAAADLAPGGDLRGLSAALSQSFIQLNKKIRAADRRPMTA